jgi:hypothetical protein
VIGSLTFVLAAVWIRVLAEIVGRETDVEWTFWGMFGARFMLPHQRERYIARKTRVAVEIPTAGGGAATPGDPEPAVSGAGGRAEQPRVSA